MVLRGQSSVIRFSISPHLNLSSFVPDGFLCLPDVLLQCVFFPENTKRQTTRRQFNKKTGKKIGRKYLQRNCILYEQTASQKLKAKEAKRKELYLSVSQWVKASVLWQHAEWRTGTKDFIKHKLKIKIWQRGVETHLQLTLSDALAPTCAFHQQLYFSYRTTGTHCELEEEELNTKLRWRGHDEALVLMKTNIH